MHDVIPIYFATGGRAMSREATVSLLVFISVIMALIEIYLLHRGIYLEGGARGQPMRTIYKKDNPARFAVFHTFWFALIIGMAALAYFLYTHLPENWRG
jgi:hypothetical protein